MNVEILCRATVGLKVFASIKDMFKALTSKLAMSVPDLARFCFLCLPYNVIQKINNHIIEISKLLSNA